MTTIDVESPVVTWGVGLFETMIVVHGRVPFLDRHHARMGASSRTLGLPEPASDELERACCDAAAGVEAGEGAVRCLWIAADRDLDAVASWRLVAQSMTIPAGTTSRRANGRVVLLDPSLARGLPEHKTTSYLSCIAGLRAARAACADEGLFVGKRGKVLEGTTTNIFAIRGNVLRTPPRGDILPGITRGWVIENAERAGLGVVESTIERADLLAGSFMTGSLTKLAPIRSVDGESCVDLPAAFDRLVTMYDEALRVGL